MYKSLIARGKAEGVEEGQVLSLRETLIEIFDENFPQLSVLAKETLSTVNDRATLQKLIARMFKARNEKEAKKYLLEIAQQKS